MVEGGSPAEYVFIAEDDSAPHNAPKDVGTATTGAIGSDASQMYAGASKEEKKDVYDGHEPVLDTAKYADYVLPEAGIYERWELMSGPNDCITLCEPAIEPIGECKDFAEIYQGLAERVGLGDYFTNTLKEWLEYKVQISEISAPIMAKITEEEDPSRVGESAPVTWEPLSARLRLLRRDARL